MKVKGMEWAGDVDNFYITSSDALVIGGAGEIGQGIRKAISDDPVDYYDPKDHDDREHLQGSYHVLFFAIRYFDNDFVEWSNVIRSNVLLYNPDVIFVHTTTPIGWMKWLERVIHRVADHVEIVHFVPRAKHPDIAGGLRTYRPIIGVMGRCTDRVKNILQWFNPRPPLILSFSESELAKLISLARYSQDIIFCKLIGEVCQDNNYSFEDVYQKGTDIYNEGIRSQGLSQYVRPILSYEEGPIGGHCVVPALQKLKESNIDSTKLDVLVSTLLELNDMLAERP